MGKLIFKTKAKDFSPELLEVCENYFLHMVEQNPLLQTLVNEVTQDRDIIIEATRSAGWTTRYGAHWDNKNNTARIVLDSDIADYKTVTPEMLLGFLKQDAEPVVRLIEELCNAGNKKLNDEYTDESKGMNNFDSADAFARHMEYLEFFTYLRAMDIVNYGVANCDWPSEKFPLYNENEFERYFTEIVDNTHYNSPTHADYYREAFNRFIAHSESTLPRLADNIQSYKESTQRCFDSALESYARYEKIFDEIAEKFLASEKISRTPTEMAKINDKTEMMLKSLEQDCVSALPRHLHNSKYYLDNWQQLRGQVTSLSDYFRENKAAMLPAIDKSIAQFADFEQSLQASYSNLTNKIKLFLEQHVNKKASVHDAQPHAFVMFSHAADKPRTEQENQPNVGSPQPPRKGN